MPYKGSDLSPAFKSAFRMEKNRITKHLTSIGCTEIKFDYGFEYFSGFFTSKSGQVYYLSASTDKVGNYDQLMYRTARNYKDFSGGTNQWVNRNELYRMRIV